MAHCFILDVCSNHVIDALKRCENNPYAKNDLSIEVTYLHTFLKQSKYGRFGAFSLVYPEHIPRTLFDPLRIFKDKNKLADRNYEMWTDGTVHERAPGAPLVTDPEIIAFEQARAAEAEAQDAAGEGRAEARFGCALRVDFLVALTFELNLWKLSTREVNLIGTSV